MMKESSKLLLMMFSYKLKFRFNKLKAKIRDLRIDQLVIIALFIDFNLT